MKWISSILSSSLSNRLWASRKSARLISLKKQNKRKPINYQYPDDWRDRSLPLRRAFFDRSPLSGRATPVPEKLATFAQKKKYKKKRKPVEKTLFGNVQEFRVVKGEFFISSALYKVGKTGWREDLQAVMPFSLYNVLHHPLPPPMGTISATNWLWDPFEDPPANLSISASEVHQQLLEGYTLPNGGSYHPNPPGYTSVHSIWVTPASIFNGTVHLQEEDSSVAPSCTLSVPPSMIY